MTITTDFKQMNQNKHIAEMAIKIRADMEYTLRVLDEQISHIDESIAGKNFSSIPDSIKIEGANILNDFKTLRDHLNSAHSEFLTIP
jgi:hypothetical protein